MLFLIDSLLVSFLLVPNYTEGCSRLEPLAKFVSRFLRFAKEVIYLKAFSHLRIDCGVFLLTCRSFCMVRQPFEWAASNGSESSDSPGFCKLWNIAFLAALWNLLSNNFARSSAISVSLRGQ
jgi:hypothetical protein